MFDLKVIDFKQKVINEINNSELPITVINYVLNEINMMVRDSVNAQIEEQKKAQEQQALLAVEDGAEVDGQL